MADKKISALPSASTPLTGSEVLPVVQGGVTDKVSVNNLTAGRTVPATRLSMPTGSHTMYVGFDGATDAMQIATQTEINLQTGAGYGMAVNIDSSHNVNVSQGNVKLSTAGKGIDFSANGGDVLSQYDEGSWTVKLFDAAGGGNQSATTVTGYYTRVGNLVHCAFWGLNNISTAGMTAGNVLHIELPFTASATGSGTGSFASENITFNGRDNATPAVPVGYNRAIIRAYGSATSSASVLVSNVGAGANIDYFSMTYRV